MSTILLVSGSQRRESFNARLLRRIAASLALRCAIDELSSVDVDLPLFDQDLEAEAPVRARVAALSARFARADGFVFACPEYNGQLTPYLKNLVDWVSRWPRIDASAPHPFEGRPALLCSASTGWSGGAVAQPHARALFGYVGCDVIGGGICVPYAAEAWIEGDFRFDPAFDAQIDDAAARLLARADACARTRAGALPA